MCEGKTDNIYLLHAIKHFAAKYPKLAGLTQNNKAKLNVRILRTFDSSAGRVLHLAQGWSGLKGLIESYVAELQKFKAPGLDHAVILLVDNDSAVGPIFNAIKNATGIYPSNTHAFIHVAGNMYVVLTPLKDGAKKSEIEDCFDDSILKLNLGGKTFKSDSQANTNLHFGKHILSQYVRDHAATIDFSGFSGVLDAINAAVDDYETKKTAPTGIGVHN